MITKLLYTLPLLIATVNCQFGMDAVRPDVTFGDHNDRFDISSMMRKQNRLFREIPEDHMRRSRGDDDDDVERFKHLEAAFNEIQSKAGLGGRRNDAENDSNFAYHDQMVSREGADDTDYERNLKKFQRARPVDDDFRRARRYIGRLHGGDTRRAGGAEKEILMHYAVPIDMKVKGYLQAPLAK